MRFFRLSYLFLAFSPLLWSGCGTAPKQAQADTLAVLYQPRYATHFELRKTADGGALLRVRNPWQGADSVVRDYPLPEAATRLVCMSSSHVAFLDALGKTDAVAGVSGRRFISNPAIRNNPSVAEVGYEQQLNYELIVGLGADWALTYEVAGENSAASDKLRQLGVRTLCVADYLENNPLGRAEWIVAFGALTGVLDESVRQFEQIERAYLETARKAASDDTLHRPRVMLNAPYRDVWYLPGDRSYLVRLIRDAGGSYLAAGVDNDVSRPVSSEQALLYLSRADVWLNPGQGVGTLRQLQIDYPRFAHVPAVARGAVYNNDARSTPEGGSDFWESGNVHPERILADLVRIFHPDRMPGHTLYYFRRLE